MPRFLEKKLKEKYGSDSSIPYKIMNKLGYTRGSKETAKGAAAQKKHDLNVKGEADKDSEVKRIKKATLTQERFGYAPDATAQKLNTNLTMGSAHKSGEAAKPVTVGDKLMSQEHLLKRHEVDGMTEDTPSMLKASIKWGTAHRDDHDKAIKKAKKLLSDHVRGKLATQFKGLGKGY